MSKNRERKNDHGKCRKWDYYWGNKKHINMLQVIGKFANQLVVDEKC